jgi:predicted DNA binding CopG/RHH family protein
MQEKTERFEMRVEASFLAAIEESASARPAPRAEAIRRLVDQALKASDPRARKR